MPKEEFATEYRAVDHHTQVVNRMADNTERQLKRMEAAWGRISRLQRSMSSMGGVGGGGGGGISFGGAGGAVSGALSAGMAGLGGGLAAGAAAMTGFTGAAIRQAGAIEQLTSTYAALGGGFENAARKMDFLKRFATTAMGEFADLAEAGTLLESSGLNLERLLPTISSLSGAFGASRENVMSLASAFGRLASGSAGEALERLREFGVTQAGLMSKGIKFSNGNQLQSSVRETFNAIEQLVREKFGNISKYASGTLSQTFSNLKDHWGQMLTAFGNQWMPFVKGLASRAGSIMSFLTDSNIAGGIGKRFADNLSGMFGGAGLEKFAFTAVAFFEQLPSLAKAAWGTVSEIIVSAYNFMGKGAIDTYNLLGKGWHDTVEYMKQKAVAFGNMVVDTLNAIVKAWNGISLNLEPFTTLKVPQVGLMDRYEYKASAPFKGHDPFVPIDNPMDILGRIGKGTGLSNLLEGIGNRAGQLQQQFGGFQGRGTPGAPDGSGFDFFNKSYIPQQEQIKALRENTAMIRKSVDLRSTALGGGSRGARGVPLAEMAGALSRGSVRPISINLPGGYRTIEEMMADVARRVQVETLRSSGW